MALASGAQAALNAALLAVAAAMLWVVQVPVGTHLCRRPPCVQRRNVEIDLAKFVVAVIAYVGHIDRQPIGDGLLDVNIPFALAFGLVGIGSRCAGYARHRGTSRYGHPAAPLTGNIGPVVSHFSWFGAKTTAAGQSWLISVPNRLTTILAGIGLPDASVQGPVHIVDPNGVCWVIPVMGMVPLMRLTPPRRTVLPLPNMSQAKPRRGKSPIFPGCTSWSAAGPIRPARSRPEHWGRRFPAGRNVIRSSLVFVAQSGVTVSL